MNDFLLILGRASLVGLFALLLAGLAQRLLDNRVPAAWRVWIWRAALIQMTLALLPLSPIALSILPAPARISRTGDSKTTSTKPLKTTSKVEAPDRVFTAPKTDSTQAVAPPTQSDGTSPIKNPVPDRISKPEIAFDGFQTNDSFAPTKADFGLWVRSTLLILYLCGCLWQMGKLWRGAVAVRRLLNECQPVDDSGIEEQARRIAARFSINQIPRLRCIESGSPLLVGILRPTIVLPQTLLRSSSSNLESIIAHELAHLKRRDLSWSVLLWLIETLFWFHPLSWFGRRYLALETESACDEMVLLQTQISPRSYGTILLEANAKLESTSLISTPLVAGVTDGFDSICKRIARLGQASKRPKSMTKISFLCALALTFTIVVPFRFVARAQVKPSITISTEPIKGVVLDENNKPVKGAKIYALHVAVNGSESIETVTSDSDGKFEFSSKVRPVRSRGIGQLFADAGTRGMGSISIGRQSSVTINLSPSTLTSLRFIDAQKRPVKGLKVSLWRVGTSVNYWMALPKTVLDSMRATTDSQGIANFPALPSNTTAQFSLDEAISKPTIYGMGDIRGKRFAPLSTEERVSLRGGRTTQTIQLQNVANIEGRVLSQDGKAIGNVLVMARRINAAEERGGKGDEIDQFIAQTRSNAKGQYVLDGLKPGKYWLWIYPEKRLVKEWIGQSLQKTFPSGKNVQNLALSRGALIEGTVVSQGSKQPVKGQTMGLQDSQENYQYTITDERGYFRFRVLGGKQHLWVHANGSNSPPPGFALPARSEFDFSIQNGARRSFKIEMPGRSVVKPITGTVIGPDGQTIADAVVKYRMAGRRDYDLHKTRSDANGNFSIPPKWSAQPVQLMAESGDLTTARSTIVLPNDTAKLRVEPNMWASIEGRVVDQDKQPVPDASVTLHIFFNQIGIHEQSTISDENGVFRFTRLHPRMGAMVSASKVGFSKGVKGVDVIEAGRTHKIQTTVSRAPQTLSGVVLTQKGKPAPGFQIWANGQSKNILTGQDGRFFVPQVYSGPIKIRVTNADGSNSQIFSARGGDKNLLLRWGKGTPNRRYTVPESSFNPSSLIGQLAPEIRAVGWSNEKPIALSSLRGQPVLLAFRWNRFNINFELGDFAQSFAGKVNVIGIQGNIVVRHGPSYVFPITKDALTLGFPIALDAPPSPGDGIGGQTFKLYGNVGFVAIDKNGKIIYAGDDFGRAITFAAADAS